MLEGLLKGLDQPEYIHALINPLPVYGLAMGLVGLIIGLAMRSRYARISALALILIAATSAWPVLRFGQQGSDRVKAMSDSEGEKWLEEHKRRAEALAYVFYAAGAFALVSIGAEWKRSRAALPLAIATLVLSLAGLGAGGYIAYAGGHIRHKEFRFEPAPEPRATEHRRQEPRVEMTKRPDNVFRWRLHLFATPLTFVSPQHGVRGISMQIALKQRNE